MEKAENEHLQSVGKRKDVRGLLWVLLVAGSLIAVYKWAWWSGKQAGFAVAMQAFTLGSNKPGVATPTVIPKPTAGQMTDGDPVMVYTSPGGNYEIKLWEQASDYGGKCLVRLSDKNGRVINLEPLLGLDTIGCDEGMGNFSSDFVRWGKNGKFVLRRSDGIVLVDIQSQTLKLYPTAETGTELADVDKNLSYWLFGPTVGGGQSIYRLRDGVGRSVKTIVYPEQNDGYQTVMYDEVNNGFLFVTEGLDQEATRNAEKNNEPMDNGWFWTKFDWLDLETLSVKTLLKTDPTMLGGRGCYRETLKSVPGTIIIKGNSAPCILIDGKYLESDGTLKLPI